ncbi:MAG: type II toxin-antitoxin system RelE/ParE family toxin [Chloroflexi bacterium]|nr:type II toxin-antitoxin system RelE/ParE family toxin [Chloroflexota bacterium]
MERWQVRLSGSAQRDHADILRWTMQSFGAGQAQTYRELMRTALRSLGEGGPEIPGSRLRADIREGVRTPHIQRPGRHLLLYRSAEPNLIEFLRILHDAMDLARHSLDRDPD